VKRSREEQEAGRSGEPQKKKLKDVKKTVQEDPTPPAQLHRLEALPYSTQSISSLHKKNEL
jgi:hypothetical protein